MTTASPVTIADQLSLVRQRITQACAAAGRDPGSVQLLAVSKTFGADAVLQAVAAGQRAFGENYIQEGVDKILALREWQAAEVDRPALTWHCIGPIQSNKTRPVAEHFDWVQSVDRLKIAQRLSEQRPAHLPPLQICLQVNVDGGANKSGVTPGELAALAQQVQALPRLVLRGLMAIPEPAENPSAGLVMLQQVHLLFDELNASGVLSAPMDTLSMGMTGDMTEAIQAGSTMVRVGTAIFGGRVGKAG